MKRIALAAAAALLLTGCVTSRDLRTPMELDRDAEIWNRAHGLRVASSPEQLEDCIPLGVVSERYSEGPPADPTKRQMAAAWPEYVLRFKTAELGGNAALLSVPVSKWTGQLEEWRVLGEAYRCGDPALTAASQVSNK